MVYFSGAMTTTLRYCNGAAAPTHSTLRSAELDRLDRARPKAFPTAADRAARAAAIEAARGCSAGDPYGVYRAAGAAAGVCR